MGKLDSNYVYSQKRLIDKINRLTHKQNKLLEYLNFETHVSPRVEQYGKRYKT